MGKALQGLEEIGLGLAAIAAVTFSGGIALSFIAPYLIAGGVSMLAAGVATEIGAGVSALLGNKGMAVTTREAASNRQVIYGTQRVGARVIYQSTTGPHKDQYNFCLVLDGHVTTAITGLYLDGRKVHFQPGVGNVTRNGVNFGGAADGGTYTGPNGLQYNFGGKVYCEMQYGDQAAGTVISGFTANDPNWAASAQGSPYLGGCTYCYLKLEYDPTVFPQVPEVKFGVMGKPVFDPRTGSTAYSSNPALILNDLLTDKEYGLNDGSVNQAQLIAAANICDEMVATSTQGSEYRYACHYHFDTGTSVGTAIEAVLQTMGGRLSRIGGEYWIFPAAYIAPVLSFDASNLVGTAPTWSPKRNPRDLFNEVRGTYVAPNYPYNAIGNLYDLNGWYEGQIQNNWTFGFTETDYPYYAADALHGYAADQFLGQDGGTKGVTQLKLPGVLSIVQAQRLAKIHLLRNRQQGTGMLTMSMSAYRLQPGDTFYMTFAQNGWNNKILEVVSTELSVEKDSGGSPMLVYRVGVQETDPSIYEWSTTEEQTIYVVPALAAQAPTVPVAPTNLALLSGPSTAVTQIDGSASPRIKVTWDTPLDGRVTGIGMQYAASGSNAWMDGGTVDVGVNTAFISGIVAGQSYDVQIRSVRANGAVSAWEGPVTVVTSVVSTIASQSVMYHPTSSYSPGAATANARNAYDGDNTTYATVTDTLSLSGFPGLSLTTASTVTVIASGSSGSITAKYGSTTVPVVSSISGTVQTYTATIPANTILSNVTVVAVGNMTVYEVYIQS